MIWEVLGLVVPLVVGMIQVGGGVQRHSVRRTLDLDSQVWQRLPEGAARDKLWLLIDQHVEQLTAPKRWKMRGWVGAALLIMAGSVMVSGSFGIFWLIIGVFYLVLGAGILGMEIYEVTTRRGRSNEIDGVSDE